MQIGCESVGRRRKRVEQHERADLPPVTLSDCVAFRASIALSSPLDPIAISRGVLLFSWYGCFPTMDEAGDAVVVRSGFFGGTQRLVVQLRR